MYITKVLDTTRKDGRIIHRLNTNEGEIVKKYADIRCGMAWPGPFLPAFYVIIGQESVEETRFEGQQPPPTRLVFMHENEIPGIYLEPLFKEMTDDCSLLGCDSIYTDLDETLEVIQDRKQLFDDYCSENGVFISLMDAPYRNNLEMGINIVRRFTDKGMIKIPDGATRAQLSAAVAQDIGNPDDANLCSLRALQYCLGSFHKSPASGQKPWTPPRKRLYSRHC